MPADADDIDEATGRARRCAEAMYAADLASQHLGIVVSDVAPGRATARMTVTDTMVNGHDICHGGLIFTLADTAFAFACNTYGTTTVAAGADIVFIAPASLGDVLEAAAVERQRGRRTGVYDVTVRRGSEAIAEFRGRSHDTGRPLLP